MTAGVVKTPVPQKKAFLKSLMNTDTKMLANQILQYIKKIIQHDQVGFKPGL
jgi:ribosomal protein S17E